MFTTINVRFPFASDLVLLVARFLLAWIFLHEGFVLVTGFDAAAAGMAKLGVPVPMLIGTIALQIVAGLMIALGFYGRYGSAALGLFCLATAVLFHNNFSIRNELLHFEKDIAIAGGMFTLMISGPGRWTLERWLRPIKAPEKMLS
jgi:putative oxidoreductase